MEELKIDIDLIGKGKDHYEVAESCAVPFNRCITRLINNGFNKLKEMRKNPAINDFVKNPDIISSYERLKNILDITRVDAPYHALSRSFPHIIKAGKYINERNADYFLNRNYDQLIKEDEKKTMIYDVIRIVCKCFASLSEDEKNEVWELAAIMLIACCEFHKHLKTSGEYYGQDNKYHYSKSK